MKRWTKFSFGALFNPIFCKNIIRYNPYLRRQAIKFMISLDFPAVIGIEPTNLCDLDCIFCPRTKSSKEKGYMGLSLFKKIIDESIQFGKRKMIILHKDGEALLHPNLIEMIKYIKEKKATYTVQFATNGVSLNSDYSKRLLKAGLDGITFSIDAAREDTYVRTKGKDKLKQVESNIKEFLEIKKKMKLKRPWVIAKSVEMKDNANEMKEFIYKWKDVADEVVITPYATWEGSIEDRGIDSPKIDYRYPCNYLWYYPSINWDGRVSVCCVDFNCQGVIGDVSKTSLQDVWRGEVLKQFRKKHLDGKYSEIPLCRNCTFWAEGQDDIGDWLRRKKI